MRESDLLLQEHVVKYPFSFPLKDSIRDREDIISYYGEVSASRTALQSVQLSFLFLLACTELRGRLMPLPHGDSRTRPQPWQPSTSIVVHKCLDSTVVVRGERKKGLRNKKYLGLPLSLTGWKESGEIEKNYREKELRKGIYWCLFFSAIFFLSLIIGKGDFYFWAPTIPAILALASAWRHFRSRISTTNNALVVNFF